MGLFTRSRPSPPPAPPTSTSYRAELRQKMSRPQRHRLLHGYPLAAAMPKVDEPILPAFAPGRGLVVGVLPHPFCNPAVEGCGFCTFPHEAFSTRKATVVIENVIREIERTILDRPALRGRAIAGLYIGGGTANLSPPGPFRNLCKALAWAFDLSKAEVTLEGTPAAFLNREPRLVDIMREELPARHMRLSMGIQTFDDARLGEMGRLGFGDRSTFREVVELGHSYGFTVAGDLLFNLPGQTLEEMKDDVRSGADIGLDQMGLYHIVLFERLGTAWSRDRLKLATLPGNDEAAGNWVALHGLLGELGFAQTTLTNFERKELLETDRRFQYELASFRIDRFDMLGFGPGGISFSGRRENAAKVMAPDGSAAYNAIIERGGPSWDRAFRYDPVGLRVLYVIRSLAALEIRRDDYRAFFGTDPLDDFAEEFRAIRSEGLITAHGNRIWPTVPGMFYADAMAGLLTEKALRRVVRENPPASPVVRERQNDNGYHHM